MSDETGETRPGRALDQAVHTAMTGETLIPSRQYALSVVGASMIAVTGRVFEMLNGARVAIPHWQTLPPIPELGENDTNARYYAYAAEHCGEDVEPLVASIRLHCPAYSTDIAAAWQVVEAMAKRGFTCDVEWKGADREYAFTAEVSFRRSIVTAGHAVADTAPLAICRAALATLSTPTGPTR